MSVMASISTPAAGLRTAASARGMCRRRGSSGSGGWCPGPGPGRETPAPVLVQPPQSAVTAPTAVRMADPPPQPDQPPGQPPHSATMTHQVITSWHHAALQTLQGTLQQASICRRCVVSPSQHSWHCRLRLRAVHCSVTTLITQNL